MNRGIQGADHVWLVMMKAMRALTRYAAAGIEETGLGLRQILSVTRNFDTPQDVDYLFPATQTSVHHWPSKGPAQFSLRLRQLSGETLLLAMGTARLGERTTQLILIRRSALKTFIPWLAEEVQ